MLLPAYTSSSTAVLNAFSLVSVALSFLHTFGNVTIFDHCFDNVLGVLPVLV